MKPVLRRGLLWLVVLLLCGLFVRAGLWQSGRAVEKEAQLAAAGAVLAARQPQAWPAAIDAMPAWVRVQGRFEALPALRLDNQRRGERVGLRVYRAFRTEEGRRLWVDVGWRPLDATRRVPDEPALPAEPRTLAGLLVPPPSAGIALGPAASPLPDGGALALRLEPTVLRGLAEADAAGPTLPMGAIVVTRGVLRLDPADPLGYERDLDLLANTLSPDKHRGYALQWFGFAAGLLLLSLFLQFRSRP